MFDTKEKSFSKILIFAILLTVLIAAMICLYFFPPAINILDENLSKKSIEIADVSITGWDAGKRSWEIKAKTGWTDKHQSTIEFTGVTDGKIFKDGKVIVKNLIAPKTIITTAFGNMQVFGETSGETITADIDMQNINSVEAKGKKNEFSHLILKKLSYDSHLKLSSAETVSLSSKKFNAASKQMDIDHVNSIAVMYPYPKIYSKEFFITGEKIDSLFKEDVLRAQKGARVRIRKRKDPVINIVSKTLLFSTKNQNATMEGNVKFTSKNKTIFSNRLDYDNAAKKAVMSGNVDAIFLKGALPLKEGRLQKMRNPEAKSSLKETTLLKCDRFDISTVNSNALAQGNVHVIQKGKSAKSDIAVYDEKTETIKMEGNVYIQKGTEWLKTNEVIVSVKKETFEAKGGVESVFKIKKKQ